MRSTGTVTKKFLVDPNNHTGYAQVLEESTGGTLSRSYVIGDDLIGQADTTTGLGYMLADGHGSTRQLASNTGSIREQYNYDAYGIGNASNPSTPATAYLYTGQQYDSAMKQYYLRARYYNPNNGRFNQLDPAQPNNFDPASLHKYAYTQNDPVNGIDPSGQFAIIALLLLVLAALLVSVQFANAPGPGDKGYTEPAELNMVLFLVEGAVFNVAAGYVGKLIIGRLPAAIQAAARWAGRMQVASDWEEGTVWHATTSTANVKSLLKGIDPTWLNPEGRFGGAFYLAEDGTTAIAEASAKGAEATHVVGFQIDPWGQDILDLTDQSVAKDWGYSSSVSRETSQAIAQKAKNAGYSIIKFESVKVPGTYNYAVLSDFNLILTPTWWESL